MPLTLGLLSNEALSPWVNWSTLAPPLYQELAKLGRTRIIAPPPIKSLNLAGFLQATQAAYRADALFGMQGSAKLENSLTLVSIARGFVRRSAFVVDPWRPALGKIALGASLQGLEKCFIPYREAYEELSHRNPDRYRYLPFGIDLTAFDTHATERDVDIFWMGRRYGPLHDAIVEHCDRQNLTYLFREKVGFLKNAHEIGHLASRARYFVVTPPDLDDAKRTGGYSPLVMRYLEGLSAGCRLLGVLPRSGEFETFLPRASILEVKADGSDVAAKLQEDRDNPDGWAATEQARIIVRERHGWASRAKDIWAALEE